MVVRKAGATPGGDVELSQSGYSKKARKMMARDGSSLSHSKGPTARPMGGGRARSQTINDLVVGNRSDAVDKLTDAVDKDNDYSSSDEEDDAPTVETEEEETKRLRLELKDLAARRKRLQDESAKHRASLRQAKRIGLHVLLSTDAQNPDVQ